LPRLIGVLVAGIASCGIWVGDASADPVVYAAGDIACAPGSSATSTKCRERYTSDIVVNGGAMMTLALGDLQYNSATLSNLRNSYDKTWGRFKAATRPALGNHEGGGSGYFDYWNGVGAGDGPAGQRGKGYYSFDVGAWHLIALNSNCSSVSCSRGSSQEAWLKADLAAHPTKCTLAYWHHPRFSSGHDGDNTFMQDLWKDLYDARGDIALVGHSHNYERFAPQNASGQLDRTNGIREFVVGTGGAFFTGIGTAKPNSEVRQNNTFGVLKLTLHPTSYDWRFVSESGKSFTDSGSEACRGSGGPPVDPPPPPPPPPGGTTLTFTPTDDASLYAGSPSANFGSATTVETDASPVKDFLLKFTVTGVGSKQVSSAKLRLYAVDASGGSGGQFRATGNSWTQSTVNWSSAPAADATVTASLGAVSASRWYEVPVTPLITGDGTYSVRVTSTSSDGADYSSSEGSSSLQPQLVLTAG
jgi:calcineurin-like phosphoesterase family protein